MPVSALIDATADTFTLPEAANDTPAGFLTIVDDQPIEGGFDPAFGNVTWQTLISGDKTASTGVVLGVATFPAHGVLHLHRHTPPEFYFCLSGSGVVTIDGQPLHFAPGSAIFVPANAEHGVRAGADGLKLVYGFGEDAFSTIEYRFSA
ncbi:MAG: cupin domain-containing protein [Yoonia sp.]|nr:cupin domain-containing protein [Yoonia sp.]MDG1864358.1 cupin domain-containing protein [Yoonia sp.]